MILEKKLLRYYRSRLCIRRDNADGIFYFSPGAFPGLQARQYDFAAPVGHMLRGWFYWYPDPVPGRLVVFDHGLGNGHRAYMGELERLARAGYLVYSYDHTGCMRSGGADTNGFAQSLNDLDACLKALAREPALKDRRISVVGHSWGGFSSMNIAALHPQVTHVVAMSGFVSVEQMLRQSVRGILAPWRGVLKAYESRCNPNYVNFSGVDSLANTRAKVLLVHSRDDAVVSFRMHFEYLRRALEGKAGLRFLALEGHGHNPTYTVEAVAYKARFFKALKAAKRNGRFTTAEERAEFMARWDWSAMTAQDEAVWSLILEHLNS